MAPRPELRFANATEMRLALEDIISGKRQGTAKIGVGAAASPSQAAALGLADTAQPVAPKPPEPIGTGTVMGAPVEAALSVTPNPQGMSVGPQPTPRGATQGVPQMPLPTSIPQQPQQPYPSAHPPAMPAAQQASAPRRGNGLIIGLAVVALLLGAGAGVTYFMSTQPAKPVPTVDLGTTPPPPTTTTVAPTTPTTPTAPVTTLTPGPQPAPQPQPGPAPAKKDGGAPAPTHDAGPVGPVQPIQVSDAGGGQTNVVTPWGTVQVPGPRPLFWPPDQPWPPPTVQPPH
jgi:serine/threonine-protein kinase